MFAPDRLAGAALDAAPPRSPAAVAPGAPGPAPGTPAAPGGPAEGGGGAPEGCSTRDKALLDEVMNIFNGQQASRATASAAVAAGPGGGEQDGVGRLLAQRIEQIEESVRQQAEQGRVLVGFLRALQAIF